MLLAAMLWAILGPIARFILREGLAPLEIAFWRTVVAWSAFALHAAVSARCGPRASGGASTLRVAPGDRLGLVAFGLLPIALLYAALPLAIAEGGAALAVILMYTAPAWVALGGWALLGERLTARKLGAVALTIAGIAALAGPSGAEVRIPRAALSWGLASGLAYASLYLFGKRYFARYDPPTVFLHALPVAALALLPFTRFGEKSATVWLLLLVLGVFSTYGAYLAYSAGLARLEATRAATAATAEPVMAAILAFVLWGERFAPLGYLGAVLVVAGVVMAATAD